MKTIISAANDVNINAARHIKALLDEKPDAAIAFSVGRSMDGLFAALAAMSAAGEVSLAAAKDGVSRRAERADLPRPA